MLHFELSSEMPKLLIQNAEIRKFAKMLSKVSKKFSRAFEMFLTVFPEFLFSFQQFRQTFKKVEKSVQDPMHYEMTHRCTDFSQSVTKKCDKSTSA